MIAIGWLLSGVEASGLKEETMNSWTMQATQGYWVEQLTRKHPKLERNSSSCTKKDFPHDFWVIIQNVFYALIFHFKMFFIMESMEQVMTKPLVINFFFWSTTSLESGDPMIHIYYAKAGVVWMLNYLPCSQTVSWGR